MNFGDFADRSSIVTATAAIYAVFQLVAVRTQRHRDFENLYVQRYWELLDRMPDSLYLNHEISAPSPDERRLAVAYLRLCEDEDEDDLRKQGFRTDRTWTIGPRGFSLSCKALSMRPRWLNIRACFHHSPDSHERARTRFPGMLSPDGGQVFIK